MDYKTMLNSNPYVASLDANDKEILFRIFEFVDYDSRTDAADLLNRQPSLIPILLENFIKKHQAFKQGGSHLVRQVGHDDPSIIGKILI